MEAGVVPIKGVQHVLVGRSHEVEEIIATLQKLEDGNSDLRFWVGDFGSGKSFVLRTIESLALQKNFVVSTIDLTPTRRFYDSSGKALALYNEVVNKITIKNNRNGNAIETIVQQWIQGLLEQIAEENNLSVPELLERGNWKLVENVILKTTNSFYSSGLSYEFGQALMKYFEGVAEDNVSLQIEAIRWIRGDITTKTEASKELGIKNVINDSNYLIALKNLAELFLKIGYKGFVINFDESVNLYKLPRSLTREKNYEMILNLYNETKTNEAKGLFINFGATKNTVYDERRGLASYGALKTRFGNELMKNKAYINVNSTVIDLKPLTPEEIFILLKKLSEIYNVANQTALVVKDGDIEEYMESQLNRPGAEAFLTPRAVIKDYIEILSLLRQNQEYSFTQILTERFGRKSSMVEQDMDDHDEIEVY
ncbi:BREX system ATP-binding domain-containing protein [Carnobacterium viridans]|uniref:BREX system ATP-binding domain-containing protein n=1 Tax=Carnobacterium viridans TaxID=174587 RepID=UPI00226B418C|nr:BREX system ATP-binding domain-containing protein [Carnobacterium viridans]